MRVKLRDARLVEDVVDRIQCSMKNYVQNNASELGEDEKRRLIAKLAKSQASFTRHLRNNVTEIKKEELDLYTIVEEEPFNQELQQEVEHLEKATQEIAQRLNQYRYRAPQKMEESLSQHKKDLQQLQSTYEKLANVENSEEMSPEYDGENKENAINDELEQYHEELKLYRNTLQEIKRLGDVVPKTLEKVKDAGRILESISTNKHYLQKHTHEDNKGGVNFSDLRSMQVM